MDIDLDGIRKDLGNTLARYRMSGILRVLRSKVLKKSTDKVFRKTSGPELLPHNFRTLAEARICDNGLSYSASKPRLWASKRGMVFRERFMYISRLGSR